MGRYRSLTILGPTDLCPHSMVGTLQVGLGCAPNALARYLNKETLQSVCSGHSIKWHIKVGSMAESFPGILGKTAFSIVTGSC